MTANELAKLIFESYVNIFGFDPIMIIMGIVYFGLIGAFLRIWIKYDGFAPIPKPRYKTNGEPIFYDENGNPIND